MGEPSVGVGGDGPLPRFATKPKKNGADGRETYEEHDRSEFATQITQIDREAH